MADENAICYFIGRIFGVKNFGVADYDPSSKFRNLRAILV